MFHRTDGGAVITVVTTYLAWNHSNVYNNRRMNLKLDPTLFRPPPRRCEPDVTGVLSKSLEHRNTLHFNPLHHPRVGGGKRRERANDSGDRKSNHVRSNPSPSGSGSFRRGDGVARRRVVANKDGSKPAAPWESHGVDPEVAAKAHLDGVQYELNADSDFVVSASTFKDSSRKGVRSGGESVAYNRDRGWVDAGIVDGIPASKDDGSGPAHEYALLGSGSDEL